MKISQLKIKNCLGIKELEFTPGQITLIEGDSGIGKTSITETIQRFFYNKSERSKFVYDTDEYSAEKSETYIDLDDGTEMKKFINKEGKVTTTSIKKDGMSPNAPESFLKNLVNENQLNPISLIGMNDKELSDLVLSLIPLKVTQKDVISWAGENIPFIDYNKHGLKVCKDVETALFNKRADINRTIKDSTGEIKGYQDKLPVDYNADDWRDVSISQMYEAIKASTDANKEIAHAKSVVSLHESRLTEKREQEFAAIDKVDLSIVSDKKNIETRIEELTRLIAIEKNKIEAIDGIATEKKKQIKESFEDAYVIITSETETMKKFLETKEVIDTAQLEKDMKDTELMKSYIRTFDDLTAKKKQLADNEVKSKDLTCKIDFMRNKPQTLLATADMPVDGLEVDITGCILIKGRPIINLSGGERIKFVMNIVRAISGELKIILIDGFEKLSPKKQKEFIDECTGDGFQYVITHVTDGELKITAIDESGKRMDALTGEIVEVE